MPKYRYLVIIHVLVCVLASGVVYERCQLIHLKMEKYIYTYTLYVYNN